MRNSGTIFDWLYGANFVIGEHDADKNRVRRNRALKIVRVDSAGAVNRQVSHLCPQAFEESARFDNGRVLDPGCDYMIAPVTQRKKHALEGKVVRLAPTTREN